MEKDVINIKEAKKIIDEQNKNVVKSLPQGFVFNLVYGLAWLLGYGSLALTKFSKVGYIIFNISLVLAAVVCLTYFFKRTKGIKTLDSKYVKWWGISWFIGFLIHSFVMSALGNLMLKIQDKELVSLILWLVGNTIPLIIVSLCLLSGAALFKEKFMARTGAIIAIVAVITVRLTPFSGAVVCALCGLVMSMIALIGYFKNRK